MNTLLTPFTVMPDYLNSSLSEKVTSIVKYAFGYCTLLENTYFLENNAFTGYREYIEITDGVRQLINNSLIIKGEKIHMLKNMLNLTILLHLKSMLIT